MTPLAARLIRRIAATGPIGLDSYMATCLVDPEHGYYATRDPFGAAGDFTTAPEISQMFGELIGLWLAQVWTDQGRPAPFALTELGPGRGTLMADALRAARQMPGFHDAAQVHLVETSATLRRIQATVVEDAGKSATWHDDVSTLPRLPLLAIANEFFDALPIRQFQRGAGEAWHERQVGLADAATLSLGLSPPAPLAPLAARLGDTRPGDIVELCPALPGVVQDLSDRIAAHGGAALVIDYGGWRSLGDTLQAVRQHRSEPILDHPGAADLTAHVDFEAIANAASPRLRVSALTPQGVFLERLGITHRAQTLARKLQGTALKSHIAAHRRLTHPAEMGTLFGVMGLSPHSTTLPGLDG
jgi:SAM-dependent MidA family methyltransferase